jgi:hypothetical protein
MSRKLKWPEGRGDFVDRDPDRTAEAGDTDGRGRFRATPGTVIQIDDPDVADHYLDRGWVVAEADDDVGSSDTDDEPMPWDDFQDMGYEDRVAAVEAGDVDHLLDQIEDEDDSSNVQEAVEQRRTEVGG